MLMNFDMLTPEYKSTFLILVPLLHYVFQIPNFNSSTTTTVSAKPVNPWSKSSTFDHHDLPEVSAVLPWLQHAVNSSVLFATDIPPAIYTIDKSVRVPKADAQVTPESRAPKDRQEYQQAHHITARSLL